jgi:serine/threonine protein kinase
LEKIRLLGEGEFGEVWLVAANIFSKGSIASQRFALKSQLILDDSRGMNATDVILREIEMMKELRHSQLVDLVNTYQDEKCIHMLMRLVPYGELWDRMHREDVEGNWTSGLPDEHARFYAMSIVDTQEE